ncbi:MAG: phosphate ABC transporter permease PstA [Phycisphaerae bacterium]|nr:phosphate ABC transporter permease PstA [Phycisphaerae bacterium]
MTEAPARFEPRLARRRAIGRLFSGLCLALTFAGVGILALLLGRVAMDGWQCISLQFLTNFPSIMFPEKAGIKSALWGTIWLIIITAGVSVPLGLGAAVYLEEYATKTRFTRFIQLNITNLAGVPSIVYGILGLAIFIRWMAMGRSVLAGGLTMALLVLPVIIIASQEALAAVPNSIRQAAYALGATRWQMVWHHVLPAALPGIATGVILAISRAIGEAAPLVMIGAQAYIAFVPSGLGDAFTALPIQIFNWCDQPQAEFHRLAAGAIIVLLAILLSINAVAIAIRGWQQRKATW